MNREIELALRRAYGRALGTLIRDVGSIDDAEDLLHDAVSRALIKWRSSIPDHPSAWLVHVARNIRIDRGRKQSVHQRWETTETTPDEYTPSITLVEDDLLRLVFTCCHPALSSTARNTLTLRYVLGFTSDEIARNYLTSKSNVEKRLVRAKSKIRDAGIEYDIPSHKHLSDRIDAVCDVIYLLFNEGYSILDPERDIDLCSEAIRLMRLMTRMFRDDDRVHSLLALFLLHHSRISQRVDAEGVFVPLDQQNRADWNQLEIAEGIALLDRIFLKRRLPGYYQLQAAISAEHCRADTAETTNWEEILSLYAYLDKHFPSPIVTLNRAGAMALGGNARDAVTLLQALDESGQLSDYQPYLATRAYTAEKTGDYDAAINYYRAAAEQAPTLPEKRYLEKRLNDLAGHNR